MERPPRNPGERMLSARMLLKSMLQGLAVFAASFGLYLAALNPLGAPVARAMGLAVIMLANLLLVQVNSSDHDSMLRSVRRLAGDKVMWLVNLCTLCGLAVILYTPLAGFLKLAPLTGAQLLTSVGAAMASVLWYEAVKWAKRRKRA